MTSSQALPVPSSSMANPFMGSVPSGTATETPVVLTLASAIDRALAHNLGVLLSEQELQRARGSRRRSLSGLLPDVAAQVGHTTETTNLAAFGFDSSLFPGLSSIVGPFNVFDARVSISQPLLDVSAIHDIRRADRELDASTLDSRNARDIVTLIVTDQYLLTVTSANRLHAVQTQVSTAESLLKLANQLHDAGMTPGIDAVRAQVQLSTQRQRLIEAENEWAKQKLQLARTIGLPSGQPIELSDEEVTIEKPALTLDEAIDRATTARTDYQAAVARVRAAEADWRSVQTEALPQVRLNANYGALGASAPDAHGTYALSATVSVPVFDSGDRSGHSLEAAAALRQRQAEADNLREQIATEIRSAFLDVNAAEQQLGVARERLDLANQELALAQTRFSAGVTSNLEVIQAQDEVATATENQLASAYTFNAAKAALVRALGSPP
jgi:outer membrane protein TolC